MIIAAGISASGRYFFGTPYNALISADQSVYIFKIFLIVTDILNVLVSYVLIKMGSSIQVVKLGASFILLMNPVLRSIYVKKKYKLDKSVEPDYSALSMRHEVMAHSIANIIHDHTDIIVLTLFCNVKIVSVYTVYNMVMKMLKKTQEVFTSGTEAIYGSMWARREIDKMRNSLEVFEYIITAFVSMFFSTTLVMILPFVSLYTKGVHDVEYVLPTYALVITMAQMFFSLRTPYITLVQGIGHYKQTRNGAIAEAIINIVLSVVLVQFIGIIGVAVGTLVANIFRSLQYAIYIDNHVIKRGKWVFISKILWALANISLICLLLNVLIERFAWESWGHWILCGFVTAICSFAITLVSSLVFYRKDLNETFKIAKRALSGRILKKKAA